MLDLFLVLPIIIIFILWVVLLFRYLWNITMPQVFNLKEISYWQALRLLLITGILISGLIVAVIMGAFLVNFQAP